MVESQVVSIQSVAVSKFRGAGVGPYATFAPGGGYATSRRASPCPAQRKRLERFWEGRRSTGTLFAVMLDEGEEQVCEHEDEEGDGPFAMPEVHEHTADEEAEGGGYDGVVYAAGE